MAHDSGNMPALDGRDTDNPVESGEDDSIPAVDHSEATKLEPIWEELDELFEAVSTPEASRSGSGVSCICLL